MSAHTPGPWRLVDARGGVVRSEAHESGRRAVRGWVLPQVALVVGLPEDRPEGEREANARLIAAAPDLLEALEAVEATLDGRQPIDVRGAVMVARAAIAKARGGR